MTPYEIALQELGVHEIPGPESEARIIEYFKHTDLNALSDEVAWCSGFMNFCVDMAGLQGTGKANARSWLNWGSPTSLPSIGDIVVLSRGSNPAQGHVGFFASIKPGLIKVLGGNQGDKVCYSWYPIDHVLGYRSVK